MKKMLRVLSYAVLGIIILFVLVVAYVSFMLPKVGSAPSDLQVEITEERIARGHYLANHVMLCMDCHAIRDFELFAGPPKPGTLGAGGERFDHSMNFPGVFISSNITPAGVGDWTDGELYRLITTGVRKNGKPIFPVMPFLAYGKLDPEDIKSVIAYLRTLEPVEVTHPPSKADFPLNFIMNTFPQKAEPSKLPNKTDVLNYGEYLVTAGGCTECHTKMVEGKVVGKPYAGGFEFKFPDGRILQSSNITPHASGIGSWDEEKFVRRFKVYADPDYTPNQVKDDDFQTVMPWIMYAGMEVDDLKAIFAYLKSIEPVDNKVTLVSYASM